MLTLLQTGSHTFLEILNGEYKVLALCYCFFFSTNLIHDNLEVCGLWQLVEKLKSKTVNDFCTDAMDV